jgi:hypothetical protein
MQNNQIENFIGIYDNILPDGLCEKYIEYFQDLQSSGFVNDRLSFQNVQPHLLKDLASSMVGGSFVYETKIHYIAHDFVNAFWSTCYPDYLQKYSILSGVAQHKIYDLKIQKTMPGEGYHTWHPEITNRNNCNRLLVFILYLNDVAEGGETEFLYYPKRVTPKKNRLVLWPAGFTHTHRGNQPLIGEKYILTGWVEL